ncbi:MAG TPA: multicopper oxidase domain-containing protein [Candidatus Saccharimonadales bacterium]|nr:multicopper oxidase domain-containing protein [Candidatus Saccharimonadales bacterium]
MPTMQTAFMDTTTPPTPDTIDDGILQRSLTRRRLLRAGALTGTGLIATAVAACATPARGGWTTVSAAASPAAPAAGSQSPSAAPSASDGMSHTPAPSVEPSASPTVDHDANAKAVVDRFLGGEAATLPPSGQPVEARLDGGVKVFELTIDEIEHRIDAQKEPLAALGYGGTWPGPRITVTEGDRIRATFTNNLPESTGVHFHGQRLPNAMDGVPHITQEPIEPGGSFTYEFTARTPGSHMYHSHHNATDQVGRGLLGAFIVEPKDPAQRYDQLYGATQDIVWISNDTLGGFTINGRGFPATAPIVATLGETIVIRFMNEGQMMHPWHLHGMPMRIVARDGYPLGAASFTCDTLGVNPGERWDAVIECDEPGAWAFHCHVLSHAEGMDGMFGMVTALVVQDAAAAAALEVAGAPAFSCVIPSRA